MPLKLIRVIKMICKISEHNLHSGVKKRISPEYGNIFTKHPMIGRISTAQIIIIHRRKIVVNERVSMNVFYCASKRQCLIYIAAGKVTSSQKHHRSETLAAAENAVLHRVKQRSCFYINFRYVI